MQFKRPSIREDWPIAAGLLALCVIPVAAGVVRLVSLATGATVTFANATQAATQLPWILAVGLPEELPRALLMGAAWVLNLAVAERFIRRQSGAAFGAAIAA